MITNSPLESAKANATPATVTKTLGGDAQIPRFETQLLTAVRAIWSELYEIKGLL